MTPGQADTPMFDDDTDQNDQPAIDFYDGMYRFWDNCNAFFWASTKKV